MTTSSSEKFPSPLFLSFKEDIRRANVTTLFVLIKYLFGVYILQNDYFQVFFTLKLILHITQQN